MPNLPRPLLVELGLIVACIGLGVGIVTWAASIQSLPPEGQLARVNGPVSWVETSRSSVRFGLKGEARAFQYLSKAGQMRQVAAALTPGHADEVVVRYDPLDPHTPPFSNRPLFTVFEIAVAGKNVRAYSDVAKAWEDDERIAPWLGAAFVLCGLFLGAQRWRKWRRPGGNAT